MLLCFPVMWGATQEAINTPFCLGIDKREDHRYP